MTCRNLLTAFHYLFAELIEVANNHQAVYNGHPAQRDETNRGRNAERYPTKPQRGEHRR